MTNYQKVDPQQSANANRTLHLFATQRSKPRFGSGMASVDIHAWLLILALAFLLRDDPYGSLPLQVARQASHPSSELIEHSVMPNCLAGRMLFSQAP